MQLADINSIIQSGDANKIITMIVQNILILYPLSMILYSIVYIYYILLNKTKKFGSFLQLMTFSMSYCIFYRALCNYDYLIYLLSDIRQIKKLSLSAKSSANYVVNQNDIIISERLRTLYSLLR